MPDVFLSYSREDQATARRFADALQREGYSVWWDVTLKPGEVYDKVTEKALEQAGAVVVLWSRNSVESRWVRSEATTADRNGTLLPVMIEDCKRPIQFELMHSADLSGWRGNLDDPGWQQLLVGIRELAGRKSGGTTAPPPGNARPRRAPWLIAAGLLLILVLAGAMYWKQERAPHALPANAAASAPSIAVLPFANLSSDKEQEYFSDGLSEELLNRLAQVQGLRVIGRTSSFSFKGRNEDLRRIGETLGVNHILEGSVRKSGDRVRIIAQLINPADGSQIWSQTYERKLDDIFAIQEEIAGSVAAQLELKLGVRNGDLGGTSSVPAYEAFLTGRSLMGAVDADSVRRALPYLRQALELDPDYLSAKLWLIEAYSRYGSLDAAATAQSIQQQNALIDSVAKAASGTPVASLAQSYRAWRETDLVALESQLKSAMEIAGGPGNQARIRYGKFLLGVARLEEARGQTLEALRMDPLDFFAHVQLYEILEAARDFEAAEEELLKFRSLPGGTTVNTLGGQINLSQSRKDLPGLRKAIDTLLAAGIGQPFLKQLKDTPLEDMEAYRKGLREQIRIAGFPGNVGATSRITMWAGFLGDKELALQSLKVMRSQDFNFETLAENLWRPQLTDLRSEAEFKSVLKDLGVEPYWRITGNWGAFCRPLGQDFECR